MIDPLTEVVTLLHPGAQLSKIVSGAGPWTVRRSEAGQPFYCVILEGSCRLEVNGQEPLTLLAGDFVLIPSAYGFTMSSLEPPTSDGIHPSTVSFLSGETRHGIEGGPSDVRLLVGYCVFGSPPVHRGNCGIARSRAWACRRTPRGCNSTDARKSDSALDSCAAGERSSPLALNVF